MQIDNATVSLTADRFSPLATHSTRAGKKTGSMPSVLKYRRAMRAAFTAWFTAPAPMACTSALLWSLTAPAMAPAVAVAFECREILRTFT